MRFSLWEGNTRSGNLYEKEGIDGMAMLALRMERLGYQYDA